VGAGLLLAASYHLTGSLLAPILIHLGTNSALQWAYALLSPLYPAELLPSAEAAAAPLPDAERARLRAERVARMVITLPQDQPLWFILLEDL